MSLRFLLCIFVGSLLSAGQIPATPNAVAANNDAANNDKVAKRTVTNALIENATVEDAFVQVLKTAGVPGGVVLRTGRRTTSYTFNLQGMTVEDALRYVTSYDSAYSWALDHGAAYLFPKEDAPKLLDVHVESFKGGPSSIEGILALLVDVPEVRAARSRLKLHPAPFLGGVYSPQPRLVSVDFHGMKLIEMLNAMAVKHGYAIWQYGEDQESREYSLLFLVR